MAETAKKSNEGNILIHNVRLAFPDLFTATQFEGAGPFSYKATFLVEVGSPEHTLIKDTIKKVAETKWGKKAEGIVEGISGYSQKYCYIDGNKKQYDGFAGKYALASSRQQEAGRPMIIDQGLHPLTQEDGKPYGGCYVNAKVQIWAQDNQFGKAIRASLITVQFAKDGDAFGGAPAATAEGFEPVEEEAVDISYLST